MNTNSGIGYKTPTQHSGLALVMALFVLLVMTFLGIAMLNSASMQEKMAGNQKRIAESSMAAEAGLQAHLSWLSEDPDTNWDLPRGDRPNSEKSPDPFGYTVGADDVPLARFYVEDWASFVDYDGDSSNSADDCGASDDTCVLTVVGQSMGGSDILGQTRLQAIMDYFPDSQPYGGAKDIWAGENVRIAGNAHLVNTYMHSNGGVSEDDGNVTITGGKTTLEQSRITANGEAKIKLDVDGDSDQCVECSITGNAGLSDPPPNMSERIREVWMNEVAEEGTVNFGVFDAESGTFDTSGSDPTDVLNPIAEFGGKTAANCAEADTFSFSSSNLASDGTYFVNGNVEISGSGSDSFENVTIISTCNMTHNGAMQQGGGSGEVNNAFYSAGDMTFNGATKGNEAATPFSGRFFAGGGMTQNGKSSITGQIIINGSLDLNGEFSFRGANSLGGPIDTEQSGGTVSLVHWSQVW